MTPVTQLPLFHGAAFHDAAFYGAVYCDTYRAIRCSNLSFLKEQALPTRRLLLAFAKVGFVLFTLFLVTLWPGHRLSARLFDGLPLSIARAQAEGTPAPDFRLVDVQGNAVQLSDFANVPRVVNVWATWCPPCRNELPLLNAAQDTLGTDTVQFILLSSNEPAHVAKTFLVGQSIDILAALEPTNAQRATYRHKNNENESNDKNDKNNNENDSDLDTTRNVLRRYRVRGLPTTFFIDAEGIIQKVTTGELSAATLARHLRTIGVIWNENTQDRQSTDLQHHNLPTGSVKDTAGGNEP